MDSDRFGFRRRDGVPWQAAARARAQASGLDPRYLRRLRWLSKARAVSRSGAPLGANLGFILASPETSNFTYEISNAGQLVPWVSAVGRCTPERAAALLAEPDADQALDRRLRAATAGRWLWTRARPAYGKRVGWYALARAIRPTLIVEVGVHDGLGSLLLLRALERNAEQGYPGRLVSFEVNPAGGWLVGDHPLWELRIGSSRDGLAALLRDGAEFGLFVYDGWHDAEHERHDLELALSRLAPSGVVISDDAQVTQALAAVAREQGLSYHEFAEAAQDHFYPGSVLGAARR